MPRARRAHAVVLAAVTLGFAGCAASAGSPGGVEPAATVQGGEPTIAVLTFNIWHNQQDWDARLREIVAGIRALDPDVIGLQEVLQNDSLPNQAHTLADALDYEVHFTSVDPEGSAKRYGNAILTRHPVVERGGRLLEPANDYRSVAHVRINVGGELIDVYDTHLHHTAAGGETRRAQILDVMDFVDETRGGGPVILMGDFNAPVDAPEMATVRDRFQDALALLEPELADTVTTVNPATGHSPRRIDHVFFRDGPAGTLRPLSADVVLDVPAGSVWPSDHFGVIVRFAVPGAVPMRASALHETVPAVAVEDMLEGRFPGVRIVRLAGGGFKVRMWGTGAQPDGEPLYVVDGMQVQIDPNRGLYWLNPQDVESIEVLKNVSDTAMYGVRGGNGVVIITTRKGPKKPEG